MLNLAYALVTVLGPMLAPPEWGWAKIEQGRLAVARSYGRADRLLTFREFYGLVLWSEYELDSVKAPQGR
jgi:hypothetical protein